MNKEISSHFKKYFFSHIFIGILVSFFSVLNIYFLQHLLDTFLNKDALIWWVGYALTLVGGILLAYLAEYPQNKLRQGLYYFLKETALTKISIMDYQDYVKQGSGTLLQKIEAGSQAGRNIYLDFYCVVFRELLPTTLFNLIFIAFIDRRVIPFILLGYGIIFILTRWLLRFLQNLKESTVAGEEQLNKILVRGLAEFVTFRIANKYSTEVKNYHSRAEKIVKKTTQMTLAHEAFFAIFALLVAMIKVLVLYLFLMGKMTLSLGGLVALLAYIDKIYSPIAIFNVLFVKFKLDQIAYDRLLSFFKSSDDPNLTQPTQALPTIKKITFANVSIIVQEKKVLSNFSKCFQKGKIYGLVGKSGTGKSTILKTLLGLLKPSDGNLYYNEQDSCSVNLRTLYCQTFYLSQDAPIFAGTLRENIVLSQSDIDDEVIEAVLKKCQLENYYESLPQKLDTNVGEHGARLSGGEKQRVAFARMFFSNPEVIILDEATSGLDVETEERLMQEILPFFKEKLVIIVTHKEKDWFYFDEIVQLDCKIN